MYTVLYNKDTGLYFVSTDYACKEAKVFFFNRGKAELYAIACNLDDISFFEQNP